MIAVLVWVKKRTVATSHVAQGSKSVRKLVLYKSFTCLGYLWHYVPLANAVVEAVFGIARFQNWQEFRQNIGGSGWCFPCTGSSSSYHINARQFLQGISHPLGELMTLSYITIGEDNEKGLQRRQGVEMGGNEFRAALLLDLRIKFDAHFTI